MAGDSAHNPSSDPETPAGPGGQVTAFNHWVPRAYLKAWSPDGLKVQTYDLLVPHANVPIWTPRSIRSLSAASHLYTSVLRGEDADHFEKWIKTEVEDPALGPLAKVLCDKPLTTAEWADVTRYVMALDLRTPASYLQSTKRWKESLPGIIQDVMQELPDALKAAKEGTLPPPPPEEETMANLPVRVWREDGKDHGLVEVHAAITPGRELWIASMKHALTRTINLVGPVSWSIMRPHPGSTWFTSDHPVVRLNYNNDEEYDFGGGWGNKGSEVLLPLSPTHMLYRQAGHSHPARMVASPEQTLTLQRIIAERAHRQIYATARQQRAEIFRPRVVNAEWFQHEQREWKEWNEQQAQAEQGPGQKLITD